MHVCSALLLTVAPADECCLFIQQLNTYFLEENMITHCWSWVLGTERYFMDPLLTLNCQLVAFQV